MLLVPLLPQFSVETGQFSSLGYKLLPATLNKREETMCLSNINYFINDCRFNNFEENMNFKSGIKTWGELVFLRKKSTKLSV